MKDRINPVSRREFLRYAGAVGTTTLLWLTGCSGENSDDDSSTAENAESVDTYPTLESDYTEQDIQQLAALATSEYNSALGTSIDSMHIADSVQLVEDEAMYRQLFQKANRSQISEDADLPPLLTANGNIYIFDQALRTVTDSVDDSLVNSEKRADLVIQLLYHELAHLDAPAYPASRFNSILTDVLSVNFASDFSIEEIEIKGARFNLTVETENPEWKEFSIFTNLDELEAEMLRNYVIQNRKRQALVDPGGYKNLRSLEPMYLQLLERVFQTDRTVNPFKTLASTRAKKGGREEWLTFIGEKLGYTGENQMLAGFTALQFIDQGNTQSFNQLMQQ